jgi:hypothetical protein
MWRFCVSPLDFKRSGGGLWVLVPIVKLLNRTSTPPKTAAGVAAGPGKNLICPIPSNALNAAINLTRFLSTIAPVVADRTAALACCGTARRECAKPA